MEYIATRPLGDSRRVAVTVNKDNLVARKLYESRSFSLIGNEFGLTLPHKRQVEPAFAYSERTPRQLEAAICGKQAASLGG